MCLTEEGREFLERVDTVSVVSGVQTLNQRPHLDGSTTEGIRLMVTVNRRIIFTYFTVDEIFGQRPLNQSYSVVRVSD